MPRLRSLITAHSRDTLCENQLAMMAAMPELVAMLDRFEAIIKHLNTMIGFSNPQCEKSWQTSPNSLDALGNDLMNVNKVAITTSNSICLQMKSKNLSKSFSTQV